MGWGAKDSRQARKPDITEICELIAQEIGSFEVSQSYGTPRPVKGVAFFAFI
jgi:hypothetical protein